MVLRTERIHAPPPPRPPSSCPLPAQEKKEAYFVQLVAATNQVIEKIGNKVQRDGEILVSLHV